MEFFLKWLLLASVNTAATMSPGPAFVITLRSALSYGRKAGIFTAIGLGMGIGVHVALALGGIAVIVSQSILLYNIIKYAGAAYLIFIGVKSLMAKKGANKAVQAQKISRNYQHTSLWKALWTGFLGNVLNPKAVVFFTAVYAQFIDPETALLTLALYGLTSVMIEILWFSGLSLVLTHVRVKQLFASIAHWIERVCGGLLIALGVKLAVSKGFTP